MTATPLTKKLRLRPGARALVLNAPGGFEARIGPLPEGACLESEPKGDVYDFVHLFVHDRSEVERLAPVALRAAGHDAVLWISYPKKSSGVETDITRDRGWEALEAAGFRPVAQVSVDDVWSALRFRSRDLVGR